MPATVVEFSRIDSISGITIGNGSGAEKNIYSSNTCIGRDIIQINISPPEFYSRLRMSQVEIGT